MLYQSKNPHGGDIYTTPVKLDFSANINPLGTPPRVIEAMKEALCSVSFYPDPYCRKAIDAISNHENVSQDQIILGNGAAELIYSYCQAVRPGKALIPVPCFSEYLKVLENHACHILYHLLTPQDNFVLDRNILQVISENHPDVLILITPNNPTGMTIEKKLLEEIIQLCAHLDIRLFIDECFTDLIYTNFSGIDYIKRYKNIFVLKALTKTYALPGVRIGYGITADTALLYKMSESVQPWNVSVPAQAAVPAAFQEVEYLDTARKIIANEREWLFDQLRLFGFLVYPSAANFLLFQAPDDLDRKLAKEGILIRNCSNFTGLGPGWFRIAVRLHKENLLLFQTIAKIMSERS